MITQAGQGGRVAAPAARAVWEGIYGLGGKKPALAGGALPPTLPVIYPDGTVHRPGTPLVPPRKPKSKGAHALANFGALTPNRDGWFW